MNDEIKEILDDLKDKCKYIEDYGYQYKRLSLEDTEILLNYINCLEEDNTMYAQLKDEYEEEIKDLQENNEILLSNIKDQKDINRQELSMVIKRDKKIKDLQQENERLKKLNENASKVCIAEHKYGVDKAEEARDYKSRCEKANTILNNIYMLDNVIITNNACEKIDKAKNILQNGGEEK